MRRRPRPASEAVAEHLERAAPAFVRELGVEHVEANFARAQLRALGAHEAEARARIEVPPHEPCTRDAVHADNPSA